MSPDASYYPSIVCDSSPNLYIIIIPPSKATVKRIQLKHHESSAKTHRCTSSSMDKSINGSRSVVMYDKCNRTNVKASSCYISCYNNRSRFGLVDRLKSGHARFLLDRTRQVKHWI